MVLSLLYHTLILVVATPICSTQIFFPGINVSNVRDERERGLDSGADVGGRADSQLFLEYYQKDKNVKIFLAIINSEGKRALWHLYIFPLVCGRE